jgi:hypothetical protein
MNKTSQFLASSTIALASMVANAELIPTDWKTTGDSLATLDRQSGIEWLDLTQTDGMSINQAKGLLSSTFEGWRLPTRTEVTQMMVNQFPSQSENMQRSGGWWTDEANFDNQVDQFRSMFGNTFSDITYDNSFGLFKNDNTEQRQVLRSGVIDKRSDNYVEVYSNHIIIDSLNYTNDLYGVYLVSDGGTTLSSINDPSLNANNPNAPTSIPLPATAPLLGLSLLGFAARRKKTNT